MITIGGNVINSDISAESRKIETAPLTGCHQVVKINGGDVDGCGSIKGKVKGTNVRYGV